MNRDLQNLFMKKLTREQRSGIVFCGGVISPSANFEPPSGEFGGFFFFTVSGAGGGDQAPFSHFFIKLVLAAPESGLPSWLTALVAQVSTMHFFMNEVLAAPASGLPSLPTALLSQVSCARAAPPANAKTNAANINFLNMILSLRWL
jgi:hypothetical protein